MKTRPLGRKAYGSIGHLPNSRMGLGDHSVHEGQARICCEAKRDKRDRIVVQEKVDGSCVAVALVRGTLVPIGRAGNPTVSSPHLHHRMFHNWVFTPPNTERFYSILSEGERIVGEWIAQAHGTRYDVTNPFVAFDIMLEQRREPFDSFTRRVRGLFEMPFVVSTFDPIGVQSALALAQARNYHRAIDPIEGVVYRVERSGEVDFLAKFVRPDKVDGTYLPGCCGNPDGAQEVWNWQPTEQ